MENTQGFINQAEDEDRYRNENGLANPRLAPLQTVLDDDFGLNTALRVAGFNIIQCDAESDTVEGYDSCQAMFLVSLLSPNQPNTKTTPTEVQALLKGHGWDENDLERDIMYGADTWYSTCPIHKKG